MVSLVYFLKYLTTNTHERFRLFAILVNTFITYLNITFFTVPFVASGTVIVEHSNTYYFNFLIISRIDTADTDVLIVASSGKPIDIIPITCSDLLFSIGPPDIPFLPG